LSLVPLNKMDLFPELQQNIVYHITAELLF
jgi:hypothetical protein